MEAGIAIVGGHTVDDTEPKYGLVVTGIVPADRYWTNEGAQVGDALVLTKPIGTGVITTALKNEEVSPADAADVIASMKTLNRTAAEVLAGFEVHACTDITGNGLIGHALEIADASRVGLEFDVDRVPRFTLAQAVAERGKFPGGTVANRRYSGGLVDQDADVPEWAAWLLFDAQTSGGLLACVPAEQGERAVRALTEAGVAAAAVIGRVTANRRVHLRRGS
jgi:selenide, water dikinase